MPTLTSEELSCSDVSSTLYTSHLTSNEPSTPATSEATASGVDTPLPSGGSSNLAVRETTATYTLLDGSSSAVSEGTG